MKKLLLAACLIASSGCVQVDVLNDKGLGTTPCENRCNDGCCAGDPKDRMTVCIPMNVQKDSYCGGAGQACQFCGDHVSSDGSGRIITTVCTYLPEYDVNACALKQ